MTRTSLHRCLIAIIVALALCSPRTPAIAQQPAGAQGPGPKRPTPDAATFALVGAVVHTATGPAIPGGTVVVRDGRIATVGGGAPPVGVPTVQAEGLHLYPALIEADAVLGLVEIDAVRSTRDDAEKGPLNANARADLAFNPDSQLLPVALSAGIMTAVVTPRGDAIAGRSAVMRLSGWTREDMTVKAPAALHVRWPKMGIERAPWSTPAKKQEKARREALHDIDEAFENGRAYAAARKAGATEERDVQWEALAAAVRGEIPVLVSADGVDEIAAALRWSEKRHLRMVLLGGRDAWRLAKPLATAGVPVVYTAQLALPQRVDEPYDVLYRAPATLVAAGVKVALSSGAAGSNARYLSDLGGRAHAWGLDALESLRAITLRPAEIFGFADRLGSITVGKEATFFLADGDVLDTRTHVLRAWVQGREIDLRDRQKALYDRYRNRPR